MPPIWGRFWWERGELIGKKMFNILPYVTFWNEEKKFKMLQVIDMRKHFPSQLSFFYTL